MSLDHWYDKYGNHITLEEWGRLYEDEDYMRIGLTEVGPYVVSTVWLGLDHSFGTGPPVLFETLVFTKTAWNDPRPRDDPEHKTLMEIDGRRYHTEEEAKAGHEEFVTLVRATLQEAPDTPEM